MKIVSLKKWCEKNLNAMAWQRLILELYDELSTISSDLDILDNPKEGDLLSNEVFDLFAKKISEIYNIELAMDMIEN